MGMKQDFPVLEMEMTSQSLKISLADDQSALSVTLPHEMMQGIVKQWQSFQDGTETQAKVYGRHYIGSWKKEN